MELTVKLGIDGNAEIREWPEGWAFDDCMGRMIDFTSHTETGKPTEFFIRFRYDDGTEVVLPWDGGVAGFLLEAIIHSFGMQLVPTEPKP